MLKWPSEVPTWFGGWVFAARPPGSNPSDSRWLITIKYENGDCGELELEELEAFIRPADPPHHVHLYKTSELKELRKLYVDVQAGLRAGDFDSPGRACIRKLFRYKKKFSAVAQTSAKKKLGNHKGGFNPTRPPASRRSNT